MDIAKDRRMGNWSCLNSKDMLEGIESVWGIKTSSPLPQTEIIVASMTFLINFLTTSPVPLHSFGWERLGRSMTGAPIFNRIQWRGAPGGSSEFKNSTG